ncbi:IclR family transcriptional regulator [Streptomyces sp. GbtcB7]|uniref:IclR family transcriptional regulator n=1 Tax=Streptomyces sp. GbtcB7 TaxID=2824752 RepID=UPI001C2F2E24|nr:IclR family transcriptional regulator [Streptomyces sp. GbtcB7]
MIQHQAAETADPTETSSILWTARHILGAFSHHRRLMTLSEISRASGVPKSTVHRVIARLMEIEAVERHGDGYRIGMSLFALGSYTPESALRDIAMPHLEELHTRSRQTVHLAVLRGTEVVYLEKLRHPASTPSPSLVGGRNPAHCTAVGKVLLAAQDEEESDRRLRAKLETRTARTITDPLRLRSQLTGIRAAGIGVERGEAAAGLACAAVPVSAGGQTVAAVSVAFPASAGSGEVFHSLLRETAARVSRSLSAQCTGEWFRSPVH